MHRAPLASRLDDNDVADGTRYFATSLSAIIAVSSHATCAHTISTRTRLVRQGGPDTALPQTSSAFAPPICACGVEGSGRMAIFTERRDDEFAV